MYVHIYMIYISKLIIYINLETLKRLKVYEEGIYEVVSKGCLFLEEHALVSR